MDRTADMISRAFWLEKNHPEFVDWLLKALPSSPARHILLQLAKARTNNLKGAKGGPQIPSAHKA